jgi:hypothetical protein
MFYLSFPAIIQATSGLDPNTIITLVLPLVVWIATWFVNWLKVKLGNQGFSGTVLVTLIVPLLSWVSAEIFTYLSGYEGNFWALFGLGLLGTFVNEVVKQWKQTAAKAQTPTKNKLVG